MRWFRLRYRPGWTLFLLSFSLLGVFLTYRQLSNPREKKYKQGGFYNPQLDVQDELVKEGGDLPIKPFAVHYEDSFHPPPQLKRIEEMRQGPLPADVGTSEHRNATPLDRSALQEVGIVLNQLYPNDWGKAVDADLMTLQVKSLLMDLDIHSLMSCQEIDSLWISQSVKYGQKKFVERAFIQQRGKELVLKTQNSDQDTKIKCLQSVYNAEKCEVMGNYFLLREILTMSMLHHPSLIKVKGFCIRGDTINYMLRKKGVILVLEPGQAIEVNLLRTYSWKSRILYSIQLVDLLLYLENSPLGPIGLQSLHAGDFVLVDKYIKLVDLDDVAIGDKSCTADENCAVDGLSNIRLPCKQQKCQGFNSQQNLHFVGKTFLEPLLKLPPPENKVQIDALLDKVRTLSISTKDLLDTLKDIKSKIPADPVIIREEHPAPFPDQHQNEAVLADPGNQPQQEASSDREYIKIRESNFPGSHDYTCANSRVGWGCVITVHSLGEAKAICNSDPVCKAFVVFSTDPENSSLMTMVAKNSGMAVPVRNMGATLFIKSGVAAQEVKKTDPPAPVTMAAVVKESPLECYNKNFDAMREARVARERRLMAHLGHKGYGDKEWKRNMGSQNLVKITGIHRLTRNSTQGARFNVELNGTMTDKRFQRGMFVYEQGPKQCHVLQMLAFRVDRFFGLFHTPPTILWRMKKEQISALVGDKKARKLLQQLIGTNPFITGLLTPSIPYVIQKENIALSKSSTMAIAVNKFTRQEKLQLEYIFLWYMTRAVHTGHYGYKGHIMQFEGDMSFQSQEEEMGDLLLYFNHCQFSNVVYKVLMCYKCPNNDSDKVCMLGEELVQQMYDLGYGSKDLQQGAEDVGTLSSHINSAASKVLHIVRRCVKEFGRDQVLY